MNKVSFLVYFFLMENQGVEKLIDKKNLKSRKIIKLNSDSH